MHIVNMLRIACKYLFGHFRRYVFLLTALGFGFAIITTMTSLVEGMSKSVYHASQNHYAGHIFVIGFDKQARTQARIPEPEKILKAIVESGISPLRIIKRTSSFSEGILYFAGNAVRQKYVYGVDWDVEMADFKELTFVPGGDGSYPGGDGIFSGGVDSMTGTHYILISEPVARELNAQIGDDLVLEVVTRTGQRNTGNFIIRGIIRDMSIFGYYRCFIDRRVLNELLVYNKDACSTIGLIFKNPDNLYKKTEKLYTALVNQNIPMGPPIKVKEDLTYQLSRNWKGIQYLTFPLHVYVSQVTDLLFAMQIVSYFLYIMTIVIIVVSIFVTFRLLLHERSKEIGTMRAIGLQKNDIRVVLILESLLLFFISIVLGCILSLILVRILSLFSYTWIPGFEIFMNKGRLAAVFSFRTIMTNILILLLFTLPAVYIPSFSASRMDITKALSGGDA